MIVLTFSTSSLNDFEIFSYFLIFFKSKRNPGAYAVQNDEEMNYQIG